MATQSVWSIPMEERNSQERQRPQEATMVRWDFMSSQNTQAGKGWVGCISGGKRSLDEASLGMREKWSEEAKKSPRAAFGEC